MPKRISAIWDVCVCVCITFQTVENSRWAYNQASYFLDQSRIKAQTNNSIVRLIGEPMSIFVFHYVIKYMEFDMQHTFQQMEIQDDDEIAYYYSRWMWDKQQLILNSNQEPICIFTF